MYACRICDSIEKRGEIQTREMMFGTRERFSYDQCGHCGSLQIAEIPYDQTLARHYPPDYYSFGGSHHSAASKSSFRDYCAKQRDLSALGIRSPLWKLFKFIKPVPSVLHSLDAVPVKFTDRILDVGCGDKAVLLERLAYLGFKNLLGIDPFIRADTVTASGARIQRRRLSEIEGPFDLIMFHHSFEHLAEPQEVLGDVRRLLDGGGRCLIRIPTPASEAFETYGPDWVQLDAPRHLTLPSRKGMQVLAEKCGFVVERVLDDSTHFQFTASELYLKDMPLSGQRVAEMFSAADIEGYDDRAKRLNATHRGDQAAFVLKAI